MPSYGIDPSPIPTLPVRGSSALFPVRRIYCVGRNYAARTVEMGHDPDKDVPFFFQKNPDILDTTGKFPYPPMSKDVHREIEMIVALRSGHQSCRWGGCLDMTRRDLQDVAKKLARRWEVAKAFEASAPTAALVPAAEIGHPSQGAIWVDVNGKRRQTGNLYQMIWKVPEMIAYLSELFTLAAGDIILFGTPSGVGPVQIGDRLHGHIDSLGDLEVLVTG